MPAAAAAAAAAAAVWKCMEMYGNVWKCMEMANPPSIPVVLPFPNSSYSFLLLLIAS